MPESPYEVLKNVLPQWRGEKCERVCLDCSAGLGDFVLFSRFLKAAVLDKGIAVALVYGIGAPSSAKRQLIELMMKQAWCDLELVTHGDLDTLQPVLDNCSASLHFRGLLNLFVEPVTKTLFVEDYPPPIWKAPQGVDLPVDRDKPLIGLCAKAGSEYFPDPSRSMTQAQVERLIRSVPGVTWVNVHREKIGLPGVLNVFDESIERLAGVIAACDCFVSVDTFPMHLASSMGKKTFLLLPANPEGWFWQGDQKWYPTLETIRAFRGLDGDIDLLIPVL